jgi:hypothetical protein
MNANKYGVINRLTLLESRCTALEQENAQLRAHLKGALETAIKDSENILQSAQAADFRQLAAAFGKAFSDLKTSVKNGVDGKDGAPGPQGPRGDVLIVGESELADAVKAIRLKMAQRHAASIAAIVGRIEHEDKQDSAMHRHFATMLKLLLKEIERFQ